jgi:hypothetical protein
MAARGACLRSRQSREQQVYLRASRAGRARHEACRGGGLLVSERAPMQRWQQLFAGALGAAHGVAFAGFAGSFQHLQAVIVGRTARIDHTRHEETTRGICSGTSD